MTPSPANSRILWVTDRYPPHRGGMSVSCSRQVNGLRRRGFRLDVLVLGVSDISEPQVVPRDGGNTDLLIPVEGESGLASNQAWIVAEVRAIRQPYTHVVGFGAAVGGFYATTFAAWLGAKSTVLVRGNDLDRDWFLPSRGAMVREALTRADSIGAVTAEKVSRLRALYPDRADSIGWTPNSVDAARWRMLPADRRRREEVRGLLHCSGGERVIGLFGELKAKKRIPFWLEAVRDAGLLQRIRLLVVGTLDGSTAAILDDPAIAPLSLRIPFSPPDELPGLYGAADYIAIPSLFEGMPNVLLEAMACGCVPLVSSAGAMREVIVDGETGFLFAGEDRDAAGAATARALAQTAEDHSLMSDRVREYVTAHFSLDRELDALIQLMDIG